MAAGPKKVGRNGSTRPTPSTGKNNATDKYGRSISAAEAKKRAAYRESLSKISSIAGLRKARAEEMKRRKEYRTTTAVKQFGKQAAVKKDENIRIPKGISQSAWEKMTPAQKKSSVAKLGTGRRSEPHARVAKAGAPKTPRGIKAAAWEKMNKTERQVARAALIKPKTRGGNGGGGSTSGSNGGGADNKPKPKPNPKSGPKPGRIYASSKPGPNKAISSRPKGKVAVPSKPYPGGRGVSTTTNTPRVPQPKKSPGKPYPSVKTQGRPSGGRGVGVTTNSRPATQGSLQIPKKDTKKK